LRLRALLGWLGSIEWSCSSFWLAPIEWSCWSGWALCWISFAHSSESGSWRWMSQIWHSPVFSVEGPFSQGWWCYADMRRRNVDGRCAGWEEVLFDPLLTPRLAIWSLPVRVLRVWEDDVKRTDLIRCEFVKLRSVLMQRLRRYHFAWFGSLWALRFPRDHWAIRAPTIAVLTDDLVALNDHFLPYDLVALNDPAEAAEDCSPLWLGRIEWSCWSCRALCWTFSAHSSIHFASDSGPLWIGRIEGSCWSCWVLCWTSLTYSSIYFAAEKRGWERGEVLFDPLLTPRFAIWSLPLRVLRA